MGETECHYCGTDVGGETLSYRCNYCNETVCPDHRLPEKHDCPGLVYQKKSETAPSSHSPPRGRKSAANDSTFGNSSDGDRTERVTANVEQRTGSYRRAPGTTPEDTGTKGPDVNPDGSIDARAEAVPEDSCPGNSTEETVLTRRNLLILVLLALVVVGVYLQIGHVNVGWPVA